MTRGESDLEPHAREQRWGLHPLGRNLPLQTALTAPTPVSGKGKGKGRRKGKGKEKLEGEDVVGPDSAGS